METQRLRLHRAGSTIPHLRPTGSSVGWLPLMTTRWFSASPSDPTSWWVPCPPMPSWWWLQVHLGGLQRSPSCPYRLLHTFHRLRPVRHDPHLWISARGLRAERDFNPPETRAARHALRASPPPHTAWPVPHGRPVGLHAYPPHGVSRVASALRVHACCRHYPGGTTGWCRSLVQRRPPSPLRRRVGSRIRTFEACSAFTHVTAYVLAKSPKVTCCIEVFQRSRYLLPPLRLLPSGATSGRVGLAPTEEPRLGTAHYVKFHNYFEHDRLQCVAKKIVSPRC